MNSAGLLSRVPPFRRRRAAIRLITRSRPYSTTGSANYRSRHRAVLTFSLLRALKLKKPAGDCSYDRRDRRSRARIATQCKRLVACVCGAVAVGCSATLPPPINLAALIALSSPTPTLISDYEPTWQPQTITGKVVGVSDGDTITVLDGSNQQHKIRLDGIDAPESNQDFGSRAKQSPPIWSSARRSRWQARRRTDTGAHLAKSLLTARTST